MVKNRSHEEAEAAGGGSGGDGAEGGGDDARAGGGLIAKDRAVAKAFGFARMLRDRWMAWPARVGPLPAAQFELDAGAMTVVLEQMVREHLDELASESVEF